MILRVFPRQTRATPTDEYAIIGRDEIPLFLPPNIDEVHVSVTFTWDRERGEQLKRIWETIGLPVKIGGPAYDDPGNEFEPGKYLKPGYTITSRGCPNNCWFCVVPRRSGKLRELPIRDGHIIQDDNLLACSEDHITAVFMMLKRQKKAPIFSGGLEAKLIKPWHVELLRSVNAQQIFFAYDTPDDLPPLVQASTILREYGYGLRQKRIYAYVLVGYRGDTMDLAEERCKTVLRLGMWPFAMLYRDEKGDYSKEWRSFQKSWCRPAAVYTTAKKMGLLILKEE